MKKLNNTQKKARQEVIDFMIEKCGKNQVEAWLNDSDKLSVINALAASHAI